jgi:pimeloyl-ACP methyl ester carboxylesterase
MQYIYLHGFASSPNSVKARYIGDRFAEVHVNLKIPDLNGGNFFNLTITRQLTQVALELNPDFLPVTLIGSSLGGLISAHLGQQQQQVHRQVLLAPAFGFLSHWLSQIETQRLQDWQKTKSMMVYHYGEDKYRPLSYDFVTDAAHYSEDLLQRPVPTLIIHGQHDEVIPIQASREFAKTRPWVDLIELDSSHALDNVLPTIWQKIQWFCQIP